MGFLFRNQRPYTVARDRTYVETGQLLSVGVELAIVELDELLCPPGIASVLLTSLYRGDSFHGRMIGEDDVNVISDEARLDRTYLRRLGSL